ncbi:MAG: hypothetical protein ACP5R4_05230, partial [Armatimonadota bacterium]
PTCTKCYCKCNVKKTRLLRCNLMKKQLSTGKAELDNPTNAMQTLFWALWVIWSFAVLASFILITVIPGVIPQFEPSVDKVYLLVLVLSAVGILIGPKGSINPT